jgi:hypothetical protein
MRLGVLIIVKLNIKFMQYLCNDFPHAFRLGHKKTGCGSSAAGEK